MPADDPALTSRRSAFSAFRFARLVYERGIETANSRRHDASRCIVNVDYAPAAGRNTQIQSQHSHHHAPRIVHNRKWILTHREPAGNIAA
jgi:hypothetical protein